MNTHYCIINGVVKLYDLCNMVSDIFEQSDIMPKPPSKRYDPNKYEYFGTGYIYMIHGVKQSIWVMFHFYKYKETK